VRFAFGDFAIDEETRQFWRAGVDHHLSPKAFDLLTALIRARPRVLTKAELHASLWPDTFVTDASLATLVAEIRGAVDERASGSRIVRTVHRRGYAFAAEVTELPSIAESSDVVATTYWLQAELRQIGLSARENIVGRDRFAKVWLDSPTVSRRHARILIDAGRVTVEDLGSKNGTFVRDKVVVEPVVLSDGDEIRFGSIELTFRVWAAGASTTSARALPRRSPRSRKRR